MVAAQVPSAAIENIALWHERDISHSSVERVIMPEELPTFSECFVTGTAADIANVAAANRNAEINSTAQVANARTAQQGQQFGASHELATQRLALDSRKADITDAGAQMDNATKKQIQDLNAAILKEPPGPKRDAMLEAHQTLTGKYQRPDPAARDVYGAIAGGTDAMGNKTDPIIYNKQTGQRAEAQGQATAPKVDEVRGGYKFKGGNPADQKNWEKV